LPNTDLMVASSATMARRLRPIPAEAERASSSAAQASPRAAPFGVHARAPRCSGSAPELSVLHRQRPSAPPRRAELAHAEPLLPDPHALAGAVASRSPALRPRARRRCGHARSSLRRSRPPRAEEGESGGRAEEGGAGGEALVEEGGGSRHAEGGLTGVGEVEGAGSPPHEAGAGAGVGMKKSRGRRRMEGGRG